jgi:hypothetical protein
MATIEERTGMSTGFYQAGQWNPQPPSARLHDLFLDFKEIFPHSSLLKNTDADWNPNEAKVPRERVCSTQFFRRLRDVKKRDAVGEARENLSERRYMDVKQ